MKHIILSLFLLIPTLAISSENDNNDNNISIPTETLKNFELTTLKGKSLHIIAKENGLVIQELKGKVVFLSFFGYNCPPCKREIPEFIKMRKKYGEELEIVAIEVRGLNKERLKSFVQDKKITYPIVPLNKEVQKFAYHTAQKANWKGAIPFILVLDKKGEVKFLQTGLIPYEALEVAFEKLK